MNSSFWGKCFELLKLTGGKGGKDKLPINQANILVDSLNETLGMNKIALEICVQPVWYIYVNLANTSYPV